jgi:hypothetical protein
MEPILSADTLHRIADEIPEAIITRQCSFVTDIKAGIR